jgi:hypothetical protein
MNSPQRTALIFLMLSPSHRGRSSSQDGRYDRFGGDVVWAFSHDHLKGKPSSKTLQNVHPHNVFRAASERSTLRGKRTTNIPLEALTKQPPTRNPSSGRSAICKVAKGVNPFVIAELGLHVKRRRRMRHLSGYPSVLYVSRQALRPQKCSHPTAPSRRGLTKPTFT